MKTKLGLLFLLPALVFAANGSGPGGRTAAPRNATRPPAGDCPVHAMTAATPTTLPAAELIAGIEEERLAHDLYVTAAERWGLRVFTKVAAAETRHEATLLKLAATAGVVPPPVQPGVYATAEIQQLYRTLNPLMKESANGALLAAALVEETDIVDLRLARSLAKDAPTQAVLTHLEQASARHLRAFVRSLEASGTIYAPKVLSAADYEDVIFTAIGHGRGRDLGRGNGRGMGRRGDCDGSGVCDGSGPHGP